MSASSEADNLANTVGGVRIALKGAEKQLRTLSCDLSGCARSNDTKEPLSFYGLTSTRTALKTAIDDLTDVLKKHSALFLASPDSE